MLFQRLEFLHFLITNSYGKLSLCKSKDHKAIVSVLVTPPILLPQSTSIHISTKKSISNARKTQQENNTNHKKTQSQNQYPPFDFYINSFELCIVLMRMYGNTKVNSPRNYRLTLIQTAPPKPTSVMNKLLECKTYSGI